MALKDKPKRFAAEYLIDLNGTQAAIRAGYSARSAYSTAERLLRNADVQAAVQAGQAARSKRTEITADKVLTELAKVGFANLTDVISWGTKQVAIGFDDEGRKLAAADIGDAVMIQHEEAPYVVAIESELLELSARAAVSEVALTKDGLKLKMHDKVGALTQIGRHLGMFTDRHEHSGPGGEPIETVTRIELVAPDEAAA